MPFVGMLPKPPGPSILKRYPPDRRFPAPRRFRSLSRSMSPPEPSRDFTSRLTRRDWLWRALSAAPALAFLSTPWPSPGYEWKVVESEGRDYVLLRERDVHAVASKPHEAARK